MGLRSMSEGRQQFSFHELSNRANTFSDAIIIYFVTATKITIYLHKGWDCSALFCKKLRQFIASNEERLAWMELSWIDQPNIIIVNEKSPFLVCEHRTSLVKRAGIIYRHHKISHLKFAFALTSSQERAQILVY